VLVKVALLLAALVACSPAIAAAPGTSVLEGSSMAPCLRAGQVITWDKRPLALVKKDEVLVWQYGDEAVAHRVWYVGQDSAGEWFAITKGDANASIDWYMVRDADVLGVVYNVWGS
jgi:signal peptidase I